MMSDWFLISNLNQLDTPTLVVYPARVKQNISTAIAMAGDVGRLRPHAKTYKNKEVTLMMLEAGITKFKCATIAEAEMLAMCFAPDVLLAYQPVGPKLQRFTALMKAYPETKFSCLVDNAEEARDISIAAQQNQLVISVFIDLNIGQGRTGILPGKALHLYREISSLPGLQITGLHAYDGQLHDADVAIRAQKCRAGFAPVLQLNAELQNHGFTSPVIVAGGSPTFPVYAQMAGVECSPGTFVYWDHGYQAMLPEQLFEPAVLVIGRIISLPGDTTICIDIGHKSVSAENELGKRITFLNAPGLVPLGQSEEHMVLEAGKGHNYKVGDELYGLPWHICPTVALYGEVITIEYGEASGEWQNIARDRKITV